MEKNMPEREEKKLKGKKKEEEEEEELFIDVFPDAY